VPITGLLTTPSSLLQLNIIIITVVVVVVGPAACCYKPSDRPTSPTTRHQPVPTALADGRRRRRTETDAHRVPSLSILLFLHLLLDTSIAIAYAPIAANVRQITAYRLIVVTGAVTARL
jgi:hypothetical protein